ncbi:proline/glycine betaine ABC transporter permease [Xylanibacillus composti]|uniref:Glycine/betaine ABC transporter n=1 Tax=Xylanibacillus composti TaxID=1572762 RepID=A0A8J4H2S9_9BACL|nr:proline/glycine betaine ABC transporter permease [Xylanibacillus composti]MDT9726497.1 proline/glycine betaine ABC transporter permease [Xylanibacillus composti]GIQ69932.1 glycine/betaine ABC transporter [Xylanibacillus composti]
MSIPKIPLSHWVDQFVDWLGKHVSPLFDLIKAVIGFTVDSFEWALTVMPALVVIVIFTVLAYAAARIRVALFTLLGFLLIWNLGYWDVTMQTLALVLTAAIISIVLGVPLGILCASNNRVQAVVTPVLDFMQTMPAFVYLLPAVSFFSLGMVPGVVASVIFAIPPTIRLTNLGIRQVPKDLTEAADAFGSTPMQKLVKLEIPLAVPTIMAGINQTIMLSLSMVVIASMIGAQGVGVNVLRAVTQTQVGVGFEAGLAVVILAVVLDRVTQSLVQNKRSGSK